MKRLKFHGYSHFIKHYKVTDKLLEIRKIIYTTNAIESLNSSFRKISRHRNLFPSVDSLFKLFYLSLKNTSSKWTMTMPNWPSALSYFTIEFEDRMPQNH